MKTNISIDYKKFYVFIQYNINTYYKELYDFIKTETQINIEYSLMMKILKNSLIQIFQIMKNFIYLCYKNLKHIHLLIVLLKKII
jgi:hypothetical protein